jgi:hypothetical protein
MAKREAKITLDEPVLWFDKMVREVTVKEPNSALYIELGEPSIWARSASGAVFSIEQPETIRRYLDVALDVDNGSAFLGAIPLSDGRRIKAAFLSFFTDPAPQPGISDDGGDSSFST